MKDPYYAIRLIRRHGGVGSVVLAALMTGTAAIRLWSATGWFSVIPALVAGSITFLLLRSYVELVSLVFEKLN